VPDVKKKKKLKHRLGAVLFVIGIGAALMAIFLILRANGVLMQNTYKSSVVVISGISGLDTGSTNSSDDSSSGSSATLSASAADTLSEYMAGLIKEDGTVDTAKVPQFCVYPLINDTRAFDTSVLTEKNVTENNSRCLTASEFKHILNCLYNKGFVLVRLRDLVDSVSGSGGSVKVTARTDFKLPDGKLPLLMTEEDVNYYHSWDNQGFASKLVVQDGTVKAEYKNANGDVKVGDYDAVPILESFISTHPDFSYNGARMTLALTGYNGVLGYRTDTAYKTGSGLTDLQKTWLKNNPEFNYDQEVQNAKDTAAALLDEGYVFANKTWGNRIVSSTSLKDLKDDNEEWKNTVEPITGTVDTVVFGHDSDISDKQGEYLLSNEKFAYYEEQGYHFFIANVRDGFAKQIFGGNYVYSACYGFTGYHLWMSHFGDSFAEAVMKFLGCDDIGIADSARAESYEYVS